MSKKFNRNLLLIIIVLATALIFRLAIAAADYSNWLGFFYSTLHVVIIALGTYSLLKTSASKQPKEE